MNPRKEILRFSSSPDDYVRPNAVYISTLSANEQQGLLAPDRHFHSQYGR
jgi:hypothetical protein